VKDSTNLVLLAIGFVVGAIICRQLNEHLSYAAKAKPAATPKAPVTPSGATPVASSKATATGDHIYPVAGTPLNGGAGKNQGIHYASTGKAAVSHRVDIDGLGNKPNLEGTVWLTMPVTCSDGGKNGVVIKFWGPHHTGSACCYCTAGIGVSGNVNFGGEGPHPKTSSSMKAGTPQGTVGGKKIGFKHIIWKTGATIHQEAWVNLTGKWTKAGVYDRSTCGFNKTSTAPTSNAEVEIRSDCANVVYHSSEVVPITPPSA
jgi:hypothetical protein